MDKIIYGDLRYDPNMYGYAQFHAQLIKECELDRTETCFKGFGKVTKKDLNPNPIETEMLSRSWFW